MPVHERLHTATDGFDLASETRRKGLAGRQSGPVGGATTVDDEHEGVHPLGVSSAIAAPTGVSAADHANAGQGTVTVTGIPAGCDGVEVIVRVDSTGAFVKKVDAAASPVQITGLANGATRFDVRGKTSDGRVGPFAASVTATIA